MDLYIPLCVRYIYCVQASAYFVHEFKLVSTFGWEESHPEKNYDGIRFQVYEWPQWTRPHASGIHLSIRKWEGFPCDNGLDPVALQQGDMVRSLQLDRRLGSKYSVDNRQ